MADINLKQPLSRKPDITGQRFGRLIAIERIAGKGPKWRFQCDCGTECEILMRRVVRQGETRSCGCLRKESSSKRFKIHGYAGKPEYGAYGQAKSRCQDRNNAGYEDYGGRGIEFRFASFEEFLSAVGDRPDKNSSIDRIDNDGHYEVGNVRWATRNEQANNRRHRRWQKKPLYN